MSRVGGWASWGARAGLTVLAAASMFQVGCPDCNAPVFVELLIYRCETSPCEPTPLYDDQSAYTVTYSRNGGEFLPCEGFVCGTDEGSGSAGCGGSGGGGHYVVRVERDGHVWEGEADTPDDVCVSGGATVPIVVGDPPALPRCAPRVPRHPPVSGTLSWQLGPAPVVVTFPEAEPTYVLTLENVHATDPDTDPVPMNLWLRLALSSGEWFLSLNVYGTELRELEVADSPVVFTGEAQGTDLRSILVAPCDGEQTCIGKQSRTGLTVDVEEAVGGAAPWPALVTEDFSRRLRLRFATDDFLGDALAVENCAPCAEPVPLTFDVVFELTAADFSLHEDAGCRSE